MNFLPWNIFQFWKHNKMNSLVQEKFEVVLSAGNGGNGAIKPLSTSNWGIFFLQQLGHHYAKRYISLGPICTICLSVFGDQMLGPILEILVLPQRSFTFHTLQRKSTNFDAYLLWGSCEIGVFILPIKTILSELLCLGRALDCEWRDLKLETNFVPRNF